MDTDLFLCFFCRTYSVSGTNILRGEVCNIIDCFFCNVRNVISVCLESRDKNCSASCVLITVIRDSYIIINLLT